MNNILAIDTATQILKIVLQKDELIYEKNIDEGFSHSENIIPTIESILQEANIIVKDLNLLICTRGPGSFTGLRISMATLKGFSTALSIPLVSVPTLDVYAKDCESNGIVLPVIDAKKKCFYTAIYRNNIKESKDLDINLEDLLELLKKEDYITLTGPDMHLLYEKVKDDKRFVCCDKYKNYSKNLINMGLNQYKKIGPDSMDQGPTYIRKSDAEIYLKK